MSGIVARSSLIAGAIAVVHLLAYLVAHPDPILRAVRLGGHEYLELAGPLLSIASAIGVVVYALRHARMRRHHLSLMKLTVAIGLGFLLLEVLERMGTGPAAVLDEPAVLIGLVLAFPMAWALHWLLRTVTRVIESILESPSLPVNWSPVVRLAQVTDNPRPSVRQLQTERGPPVRVASTSV